MELGKSARSRRQLRRPLLLESLEERNLLNSDWQNPVDPADVNNDSFVSPIDVLVLINDLKKNGVRQLGIRPADTAIKYIDVSGDGFVSPIDVLNVVNALKSRDTNPQANDALNLKSFGAKGDGTTDDLGAILSALRQSRAENKRLYVPPGTYLHSAPFSIESQEVFGEGDASRFLAGDPLNSVIFLKGVNPILRSVSHVIESGSLSRHSNGLQASIAAWECDGFVIDSVRVVGGTSVGILSYGGKGTSSQPAKIINSRVDNTLADAIHLSQGSQHIIVENCFTSGNGDDGIAVVSYRESNLISRNITIRNNSVGNNYWGRGITVAGGEDILIENNTTEHTESAGIYVCSEVVWNTFPTKRVTIRNNTVSRACYGTDGTCRTGHPGIFVLGEAVNYNVSSTLIENNLIISPATDAIRIDENTDSTTVKGNRTTGLKTGYKPMRVLPGATNVVS